MLSLHHGRRGLPAVVAPWCSDARSGFLSVGQAAGWFSTQAKHSSVGDSEPAGDSVDSSRKLYADQDDTWVDRHAPEALQPYLKLVRIDRPSGTMLVLWPGLWGLALAAPPGALPDLGLVASFGLGAFIMRGAGCTINDMWDKDFDARVARTARRPIASGRLSRLQALVFLGAQLSVGLGILLSLNNFTIGLGVASLSLVVSYPLMKRVTYWPQTVLGLAMNYGVLMGWAAVHETLATPAFLMYAGGIAWTMVYDTLYAHQDTKDDADLGLKSTALLFGDSTPRVLAAFAAASTLAFGGAGLAWGATWPFYAAVAGAGSHMAWQVATADLGDRGNLNKRFVSNQWVGGLLFAGVVASNLLV